MARASPERRTDNEEELSARARTTTGARTPPPASKRRRVGSRCAPAACQPAQQGPGANAPPEADGRARLAPRGLLTGDAGCGIAAIEMGRGWTGIIIDGVTMVSHSMSRVTPLQPILFSPALTRLNSAIQPTSQTNQPVHTKGCERIGNAATGSVASEDCMVGAPTAPQHAAHAVTQPPDLGKVADATPVIRAVARGGTMGARIASGARTNYSCGNLPLPPASNISNMAWFEKRRRVACTTTGQLLTRPHHDPGPNALEPGAASPPGAPPPGNIRW